MLSNILKVSSVILLVTLLGINANSPPAPICFKEGTTEEMCKMKFMEAMEENMMNKHMEMMKKVMTMTMKTFSDIMAEMPADDPHTKMMKTANEGMKKDMEMMYEMKTMKDAKKIEEMIMEFYRDIQPNFGKAHMEDGSNTEMFDKMMEKHKHDSKMAGDSLMEMMTEFENMFDRTYKDLREMDMKKYPEYKEMNDMMSKMKDASDMGEKVGMMMQVMSKMMKFQEMPYMKAMMMAMCEGCDK